MESEIKNFENNQERLEVKEHNKVGKFEKFMASYILGNAAVIGYLAYTSESQKEEVLGSASAALLVGFATLLLTPVSNSEKIE